MPHESQIPIASADSGRFAVRLALVYGTVIGMTGAHLPFFTVWLKSVGIDASWIGIITAVPPVTRFTVLPLITGLVERRRALRGGIMVTAFATALGFFLLGTQQQALAVFLIYIATCSLWTPLVPLIDAYALRGVVLYALDYGPLRLWGSAAFVVGALICGALVDMLDAGSLIWIIAGMTALSAVTTLGLQPLPPSEVAPAGSDGAASLLRDRGFLAIIIASALIQGSHAAYYIFASIAWRQAGLSGLMIAALWALGVVAEIVLFALSPRFTWPPAMLVLIGACSAIARWVIIAQDPPIAWLVIAQLGHGLTFGLTQVGIMGLIVHHVPGHRMARGQGYLAACSGIVGGVASIASGTIYAQIDLGIYYVMAAMAACGGLVIWLARRAVAVQPQSAASGG